MIVVADTSPICYLLLIGEIDLLPALFGSVLIPEAVAGELRHESAPPSIGEWIARPPHWLKIQQLESRASLPELATLDEGERAAILLALERDAALVILDDRAGRSAAREVGLKVTGTLGLLEAAARRNLVDLRKAIDRLRKTNFRATPALLAEVLRRNR